MKSSYNVMIGVRDKYMEDNDTSLKDWDNLPYGTKSILLEEGMKLAGYVEGNMSIFGGGNLWEKTVDKTNGGVE